MRTSCPARTAASRGVVTAAGCRSQPPQRGEARRAAPGLTLALRLADRIVTAGEYHTSDIAGREGDDKRFKRPTVRKPATKTP